MPRIDVHSQTPFRVQQALAEGLGYGRLRGPDLQRPFHGVRSGDAVDLARAFAPLLRPRDRFSHVTAAQLWPLPLPAASEVIHVATPRPLNAHRGVGVVGHLSTVSTALIRNGLPVSDPVTLFIELATMLDEDSLVAVGDALVLEPARLDPRDLRPWIALADLRAGCGSTRAHGGPRARQALAHVREGAESPMETALRLLLVRAGLPEPELNQELHDDRGRRIGRFDMVFPAHRVIVEYDGDEHRTSTRQYDIDMSRIDRATAAAWAVVRVRSAGLYRRPAETISRVKDALRG